MQASTKVCLIAIVKKRNYRAKHKFLFLSSNCIWCPHGKFPLISPHIKHLIPFPHLLFSPTWNSKHVVPSIFDGGREDTIAIVKTRNYRAKHKFLFLSSNCIWCTHSKFPLIFPRINTWFPSPIYSSPSPEIWSILFSCDEIHGVFL